MTSDAAQEQARKAQEEAQKQAQIAAAVHTARSTVVTELQSRYQSPLDDAQGELSRFIRVRDAFGTPQGAQADQLSQELAHVSSAVGNEIGSLWYVPIIHPTEPHTAYALALAQMQLHKSGAESDVQRILSNSGDTLGEAAFLLGEMDSFRNRLSDVSGVQFNDAGQFLHSAAGRYAQRGNHAGTYAADLDAYRNFSNHTRVVAHDMIAQGESAGKWSGWGSTFLLAAAAAFVIGAVIRRLVPTGPEINLTPGGLESMEPIARSIAQTPIAQELLQQPIVQEIWRNAAAYAAVLAADAVMVLSSLKPLLNRFDKLFTGDEVGEEVLKRQQRQSFPPLSDDQKRSITGFSLRYSGQELADKIAETIGFDARAAAEKKIAEREAGGAFPAR